MLLLFVLLIIPPAHATAQRIVRGHLPNARVSEPTQLDWTFALSNQSLVELPDNWLDDKYDSTEQRFELYVPERYSATESWPLVVFISPGNRAMGSKEWGAACRKLGILFASPHQAGNTCPGPRRTRIVMDVLGEIRSKYNIDPDRTYIGGFSGGGRVACMIGFALPEYFGGVIPVCAGGELRAESWLRQRVIERLSVAQLTGTTDFNRAEVERWRQTELSSLGVRCKTWVANGLGHGIPKASVFTQAWKWLEEDLPRRKEFAQKWPASRVASAISREKWSANLLEEAKQRIRDPRTLYSGLMQLKGVRVRWHDLQAGQEANTMLMEFDQRDERPWDADDIDEQRRTLIARARGLDAYGSGQLSKQYQKQRTSILQNAIRQWQQVVAAGADKDVIQEAQMRIPKLQALLK